MSEQEVRRQATPTQNTLEGENQNFNPEFIKSPNSSFKKMNFARSTPSTSQSNSNSPQNQSPTNLVAQFSHILSQQNTVQLPELIDYKKLYMGVRQQLDESAIKYDRELRKRDENIRLLSERNKKLENQLQTSNLTMEILSKLKNNV